MGNSCGGNKSNPENINKKMMSNTKSSHDVKIVLIGSQSVGKSSIIER